MQKKRNYPFLSIYHEPGVNILIYYMSKLRFREGRTFSQGDTASK